MKIYTNEKDSLSATDCNTHSPRTSTREAHFFCLKTFLFRNVSRDCGLPISRLEILQNSFHTSAMGCGPSSFVAPDHIQLVWTTQPGMDCWQNQCCPGIKPLPPGTVLPPWMPQSDLEAIMEICKPFGDCICCQADCCGTPICGPSWIADGGAPLKAVKAKFPQYSFVFQAAWVGCGDGANWQHILVIKSNK